MKIRIKQGLLVCLILCLLAGCKGGKKTQAEADSTLYSIYYINDDKTALLSSAYTPKGETFDEILGELLAELQKDSTSGNIRFPAGVAIQGYTKSIDTITVDMSSAYLGLDNISEILLRAAIVRTLVQLPGVANVAITVDQQPLKDLDGTTVGPMSEEMFIDTGGMGINSYAYTQLKLYFPDESGSLLKSETREVFSSTNLLTEKIIVEQIILGPVSKKLQPVVSPGVKVNSVLINNHICQVDLDEQFLKKYSDTLTARAALYSFVNSIFEVTEADGVQFTVGGKSDVRFLNQIGLDQIFVRDADIIAEEQTEKNDSGKKHSKDSDTEEASMTAPEESASEAEDIQPIAIDANKASIVGVPSPNEEETKDDKKQ